MERELGVIPPNRSTVRTCKGQTHYIHVLEYISDCVTLSGVPAEVTNAISLNAGSPVKLMARDEDIVLTILPQQRDLADTVIRLEK